MKRFFIAALLICLCTTLWSQDVYEVVSSGRVNVRSANSTNAQVVGTVAPGMEVQVINVENDWTQIVFNGGTAYIASKFLKKKKVESTQKTAEAPTEATEIAEDPNDPLGIFNKYGRVTNNSFEDDAALRKQREQEERDRQREENRQRSMSMDNSGPHPRAAGGQFGYGLELSYEHSLGHNFIEVDLGFPGWFAASGFYMMTVGTYNWLNPFGADFPATTQGDWNWYLGAGVSGGFGVYNNRFYTDYDPHGYERNHHSSGFFGVAGRVGVEYNFWFPLQLSIEYRPVIGPMFYSFKYYNEYNVLWNESHYVAFNEGGLYLTAFVLGVRYAF